MPRYISTSILSFHGSDYIMPRYIHHDSLVPWEWWYHTTIYPPQLSSSMGVITLSRSISTPLSNCMGMIIMIIMPWCISTPHNNLGLIIMTLYFHCWQYLVRGWLYRCIIFSFLTIFGEGVIISWHYIFTHDNLWWGGDYIVTLYFHSWQYSVRGWLYRDIFSLLTIFGKGWLYREIIFSFLTIFEEGVIISWHNIFTPDNIW